MSHWRLFDLVINEFDLAAGDRVLISGKFEHLVGPHGEGPGPVFSFLLFDTAAGGGGLVVIHDTRGDVLAHGAHFDGFRADLSGVVAPAFNINNYGFTVLGRHRETRDAARVPEPATLLLLTAGLLVLRHRDRKPAPD